MTLQTLPRPTTSTISPGLLRLLNAALIDPTLGELFMESPIAAAHRTVGAAGSELFGTTLPDPALRLTLPALSMSEWDILSQMPSTTSLAEAAQELRRLAAHAASITSDQQAAEVAGDPVPAIEPMRMPLLPGVHRAWAPARREGALAGAA